MDWRKARICWPKGGFRIEKWILGAPISGSRLRLGRSYSRGFKGILRRQREERADPCLMWSACVQEGLNAVL
jgi:hypothetical protein